MSEKRRGTTLFEFHVVTFSNPELMIPSMTLFSFYLTLIESISSNPWIGNHHREIVHSRIRFLLIILPKNNKKCHTFVAESPRRVSTSLSLEETEIYFKKFSLGLNYQ